MNFLIKELLDLMKSNGWHWHILGLAAFFVLIFVISKAQKVFPAVGLTLSKMANFAARYGASDLRNALLIIILYVPAYIILTQITGIHQPDTHDEFCNLLAADTFLHGRLTNPTHSFWKHFEFFYVIQNPTYASKFPPLQGAVLALGMLITTLPIAGVFLAGIMACLGIYWMLRAHLSPYWSLYGGLIWMVHPTAVVWSSSYWGANLTVLGGTLSLGAFFRLLDDEKKNGNLIYSSLWGIGIAILLNSRPYEGTALTGILLSIWCFEIIRRKTWSKKILETVLVLFLILAANLVWTAYYNYSITGNAAVLPYSLQHSQYYRTPLFLFQKLSEPKDNVPVFVEDQDEEWQQDLSKGYGSNSAIILSTLGRLFSFIGWLTKSFILIFLFAVGMIVVLIRKEVNVRGNEILILVAFVSALLMTTFTGDRFASPIIGIGILFITIGAKYLYKDSNLQKMFILVIPISIWCGTALSLASVELKKSEDTFSIQNIEEKGFKNRSEIEEYLNLLKGKHLVLVEKQNLALPDPRLWVYNSAEIDESNIVWAHKLTDGENGALIDYFKDRNVWLLRDTGEKVVLEKH